MRAPQDWIGLRLRCALTGRAHLCVLAIAVLMVAGCGPSTPTTTPALSTQPDLTASMEPTSSPVVRPIPTPTSAATFGPDAHCDTLGLAISSTFVPGAMDVYLGTFDQYIPLATERAASVDDPQQIWPGGYDYGDGLPDVIRLRGGSDIILRPQLDYDFPFDWPLEINAARAVLRVPGEGRNELAAPITASDSVTLSIPDRDLRGTLRLEFEASDRCLRYTGSGVGQVQVVRAATVDACPVDHEGYAAHWATLADPPLMVGDVPVDLGRIETLGLWTEYAVSSQGNTGLTTWSPDSETTKGVAGGTVRSEPANPALRLPFLEAVFYRRKAVVDMQAGGDWPSPVFRSTADPYADGHFELLVPSRAGRYVASLHVQWESACAYGGAAGAIGVDVE